MNPSTLTRPIDYTGSGLDPGLASAGNSAVKNGTTYNGAAPQAAPVPPAPVPALSSSNGASAIDSHVAAHGADMAAISTAKQNPAPADTYAGLTKIYNTKTGQQSYIQPGATPSPDWVTAEEAQATGTIIPPSGAVDTSYQNAMQEVNNAFSTQSGAMDAATQNYITSLSDVYAQRIRAEQEANNAQGQSVNTQLLRIGANRTGNAARIFSDAERAGLDRVKQIGLEESSLIAQANQSLADKKYGIFVAQRNALSDLRKERVSTLQKLQDDAYKHQQDKIANDLNAKIHDDTVSYQDKAQAIQQASLDETVRKDKMAELQKAADLKVKQDAANLLSRAISAPVVATNGAVSPADQEAFLSKYTPDMQTQIKGVADYSIDPNSASKRAGAGISPLQLETLAKAYNPNYKAGNFKAVNSFLTSWASGGNNSVVQSANTVVQHLEELSNQVPQIKNAPSGTFGPFTTQYNNFRQWLNEGKSDPAVFKFKQTALLVATEMAKIMKNGSGSSAAPTDSEIDEQLGIITTGLSPDTAQAVIENGVQLMGDRLGTARENYMSVVGEPPKPLLYPSAQQAIKNLQGKGYNIDLSALDPSPLAGVSDADLLNGIVSPNRAVADPATYFGSLLNIINQPAPADATP